MGLNPYEIRQCNVLKVQEFSVDRFSGRHTFLFMQNPAKSIRQCSLDDIAQENGRQAGNGGMLGIGLGLGSS